MSDVADTAAEWFDALTGVVHQWFQYRDGHVPAQQIFGGEATVL